ncbi:Winged helix-turn-helix transcription repressor DNA-binding [Penicillium brevicompactum]|uniref:Winged helix-turn-helix transcription repressor DNA-binding n=1 Tax=Penicillium brevicompactum TaxID=5074 RepID=UPI002541B674|nr:Winged helix-turn-helix transcription repressor DNA-binding [Penicillium brevicompactum]KAJ5347653.1 Winged helix-turn-helix transcription repressor DNA-binding [Penicillium brevicompactum]
MDPIVAQVRALAEAADEEGRLNIIKTLRQVQAELQSPKDSLMEIAGSGLINAMLRVGADMGLFSLLASNKTPLKVDRIAELTTASPQLLERVLRYLAATSIIKETGVNEYTATKLTYVLADPKGEAMIYHGFDTHGPVVQAMPDFFAENKYQDVTSNTNTPFQKAHNTKLTSFEWLVQHPKHFENLQKVMTSLQGSEWTEGFELLDREAQKIQSGVPQASEKPFFVDVGGGHGHQCRELGKKYPTLLGRMVLQDLPEAVKQLAPIEGVEVQAYDFFQPQTVTGEYLRISVNEIEWLTGLHVSGAKFYYLRRIMHDWPDNEAAAILRNIVAVMNVNSRILIDDTVLPDTGANWQSTLADLAMMAFGGKERTRAQWHSLAKSAGLRVEQIHTYVASTYTAIVVLALE